MRKVYLGALFTSLQPIVLSAMLLPATWYVIRRLGAEAYGEWMTATGLVAVTLFATNLGLRATFVRAVARFPEMAGQTLAEQMGARIVLSTLAASAALIACAAIGYSKVVLICTAISALSLILTTVSTTAGDLLQGLQRLGVVATANMFAGLVLTLASVFAVYAGGGPISVAVAYLIGPIVSLLFMWWVIARDHFPVRVLFDFARIRRLFYEARFMAAQLFVHAASTNAEALFLPKLVGLAPFGYFSAGSLLASRLVAVPEGVASALYPAVVDAEKVGPVAIVRLVKRFLVLSLVACIGIAVVITMLAGPISRLLFEAEPEAAELVMRITIWLLPPMSILWVLGATLNGLNGDAAQARAAGIAAFLNLGLTAFLVWQYGLIGACWSMVLRYVVWLIVFIPCSLSTFRPVLHAARIAAPRGPLKPRPALEDR
jgi:O-antigen/teichoic acid export membrane protein